MLGEVDAASGQTTRCAAVRENFAEGVRQRDPQQEGVSGLPAGSRSHSPADADV